MNFKVLQSIQKVAFWWVSSWFMMASRINTDVLRAPERKIVVDLVATCTAKPRGRSVRNAASDGPRGRRRTARGAAGQRPPAPRAGRRRRAAPQGGCGPAARRRPTAAGFFRVWCLLVVCIVQSSARASKPIYFELPTRPDSRERRPGVFPVVSLATR